MKLLQNNRQLSIHACKLHALIIFNNAALLVTNFMLYDYGLTWVAS